LVVRTNPEAFRLKFGVQSVVPIFGPFEGKLNGEGEVLRLQEPDRFATNGNGFVTVDQTPAGGSNWPQGKSMTRRTPVAFGSEPLDWSFEAPSPGTVATQEEGPEIVLGPLNQSVVTGEEFTLSVTVAGGFSTYQCVWLRNGVAVLMNVTPATNIFYSGTAPAVPGAYTYEVEVRDGTNSTGGSSSASAVITVLTDTDSDGLPDAWENAFGLSGDDPADAALDGDGDGLSNRQEYAAGTNPTDETSALKLEITVGNSTVLRFEGVQNKTYSLEYTDALGSGNWVKLSDFAARSSTRWETASDEPVSNRYYRLVTPRKP
jgi:hypothetical protein